MVSDDPVEPDPHAGDGPGTNLSGFKIVVTGRNRDIAVFVDVVQAQPESLSQEAKRRGDDADHRPRAIRSGIFLGSSTEAEHREEPWHAVRSAWDAFCDRHFGWHLTHAGGVHSQHIGSEARRDTRSEYRGNDNELESMPSNTFGE